MNFLRVGLTPIVIFNGILFLFFTLAYFYQFIYILRVWRHGSVQLPKAKKKHSYAFVIAAHNEEPVIGNLVRSILTQEYDGLIDCFVIADACTDDTAQKAKEAAKVAEKTPKPVPAPVKAEPAPAPAVIAPAEDEDEVIAVISAVVAMMSEADGTTYRVKSVRPAAGFSGRAAWAMDGRRNNVSPF